MISQELLNTKQLAYEILEILLLLIGLLVTFQLMCEEHKIRTFNQNVCFGL